MNKPETMTAEAFHPGFRISKLDVIVLLAGGICFILLHPIHHKLSWAVLFTLAHFFLFCNVLRMRRRYELIWAALFVVLAAPSLAADVPAWAVMIVIMLAVTAVLVFLQLRHPSYHGVCWRRLNPGLPQWWADRQR